MFLDPPDLIAEMPVDRPNAEPRRSIPSPPHQLEPPLYIHNTNFAALLMPELYERDARRLNRLPTDPLLYRDIPDLPSIPPALSGPATPSSPALRRRPTDRNARRFHTEHPSARTVTRSVFPAHRATPQGHGSVDGLLSFSQNIVLGYGSSGTMVFKGSFQGRDVAVKRMMSHFVRLAVRELEVLRMSDSHPNVIRYFYDTSDANFQYIALELCPASLADLMDINKRDQLSHIIATFDPKRALREITSGLHHLHALRLVHRDIKPQNILVSDGRGKHRMLISDFGLCKQLEPGRASYNPTAQGPRAAGTVGWRAPEVLRGEVTLNGDSDGAGGSSSAAAGATGAGAWSPTRQTQLVDIFALGCLYYYVLTEGRHPFGAMVEMDANILKDAKDLESLEDLVAVDAIERMLSPKAEDRPDATTCLRHPCLWDAEKMLDFLLDASDRFQRIPKGLLRSLENGSQDVVGQDWRASFPREFIIHFSSRRAYDGRCVQDLLRLVRNARHHYHELPADVKAHLGTIPESFLEYFTDKFPKLFVRVHGVISSSSLRNEATFLSYFAFTN